MRTKAMSRILVEFKWYCGRMGTLSGLFVTTQEEIDNIIGKEVYFGEVLGKHSEIQGEITAEDFKVKSDDQAFIDKLVEVLGEHISGYSPFDYIEEDEEDESDEE